MSEQDNQTRIAAIQAQGTHCLIDRSPCTTVSEPPDWCENCERAWLLAALARLQAERDEARKLTKLALAELAGYQEGFEGRPSNPTYGTSDENMAYILWFGKARRERVALIEAQEAVERRWKETEAARDDWKHEWDLATDAVKALNDARLSAEAARDEAHLRTVNALNVIEEQQEQIATLEAARDEQDTP